MFSSPAWKGDLAVEQVEPFVLARVDVQRRLVAGTEGALEDADRGVGGLHRDRRVEPGQLLDEPMAANGRERQRNRTRRLLVQTASELIRNGHEPSIAELAEAEDVSRATAYRYFPTREVLLAEVALFSAG